MATRRRADRRGGVILPTYPQHYSPRQQPANSTHPQHYNVANMVSLGRTPLIPTFVWTQHMTGLYKKYPCFAILNVKPVHTRQGGAAQTPIRPAPSVIEASMNHPYPNQMPQPPQTTLTPPHTIHQLFFLGLLAAPTCTRRPPPPLRFSTTSNTTQPTHITTAAIRSVRVNMVQSDAWIR